MSTCHYCGPTDRELRPYGPGGSDVCAPCVKADPEREAAAKAAYWAQSEAVETLTGGVVVIGDEEGPRPLRPGDLP